MPESLTAEEAMEKVERLEDLQATFKSGIMPTHEALVRASELGIDVETLERAYADSEN